MEFGKTGSCEAVSCVAGFESDEVTHGIACKKVCGTKLQIYTRIMYIVFLFRCICWQYKLLVNFNESKIQANDANLTYRTCQADEPVSDTHQAFRNIVIPTLYVL